MKPNKNHKICGIYCIKNKINNKVYIGKSKNIYKRIYQHLYDLKNKRIKNENSHFLNAWYKYGEKNFEYFILEELNINENLCKEKELYWITKYNSIDRKFGYNLRLDSESKMIIHKETSLKISKRLKKEWLEGKRNSHSEKLSKNWKNNPDRKIIQSKIMSNNLTKYTYNIYDLNMNFIENCNYDKLKKLNLQGSITSFYGFKKRNSNKNICKCKNYFVERINIEDIVQSSEKFE